MCESGCDAVLGMTIACIATRQHKPHIVLANVSADDNRGGAAITIATARAIASAAPSARIDLLPAAAIADLGSAFRHTRAALPEATLLEPLFRGGDGIVGGARIARAATLSRLLVARGPFMPRAIQRLLSADAVITRGDALFVDRPSARGLLSVWAANFPGVLATRWGVPAILSGTEIGPFEHSGSRVLARVILRRADLVIARNAASAEEALALGVPVERVEEVPDPAFSFERPSSDTIANARAMYARGARRFGVVTVGVDTPIPGMRAALAALHMTLRGLLDGGTIDRVLVVLQVDGRHITDHAASREFVEQASDPRISLVADDLAPSSLVAVFGAADFTLGTRMHMGILSLVAGTPTFVLALWPKVRKLFGALDLGDVVVSYPDLDPAELRVRIARTVEQGRVARERARAVADSEGARYLTRFRELLAVTMRAHRAHPE